MLMPGSYSPSMPHHQHSGDSFDSFQNSTPSPPHVVGVGGGVGVGVGGGGIGTIATGNAAVAAATAADGCSVTLNVGGVKYVTQLRTLIGEYRESIFAEVFAAWPTVMAKYVDAQGKECWNECQLMADVAVW